MSSPLSGWRLPLRLAWRDLLRYKGRSALAALLILLPVGVIAGAMTFATTSAISDAERRAAMFENARAYVQFGTGDPSAKTATFPAAGRAITYDKPPTAAQVSTQLGGAPVTGEITTQATLSPLHGGPSFTAIDSQYFGTDLTSPLIGDTVTVAKGRLPRTNTEIVVTDLGLNNGLPDHGTVQLSGYVVDGKPVTVTVVGVVHTRLEGISAAGPILPTVTGPANEFAIGGSTPFTGEMVTAWQKYGASVESKDYTPPAEDVTDPELYIAVVVGIMAVICVTAMLAAPAFAAAATRHRRTLGLVGSNGGTRATLRRMILAQALLIGALTAVVSCILGGVIGVFAARWYALRTVGVTPPVDIKVGWLAGLALVATVASLVAALVPARTAGRTNLLVALRGQVSARRVKKRWPTLGVVLSVLGTLCLAGSLAASDSTFAPYLAVLGLPLVFVGAVLAVPYVLMAVGFLAGRLPVTARLAVRDVSRQRTRATASVSGILATVAVFSGVAVFGASMDRYEAKTFRPDRPVGTGVFDPSTMQKKPTDAEVASAAADVKAISGQATVRWMQYDTANTRTLGMPGQCAKGEPVTVTPTIVALDADGLATLKLSAAQRDVIDRGGVLVVGPVPPGSTRNFVDSGPGTTLSPSSIKNGHLQLTDLTTGATDNNTGNTAVRSCANVDLPAAEISADTAWDTMQSWPGAIFMSRDTAAKRHLPTTFAGIQVAPEGGIDRKMESQLQALAPLGMRLTVEHGYRSPVQKILALMAAAFGLVVLLTTVVTTLLNDAESQADAATLATIGAPTGMRRRVVGAQAFVLGFVGAAVGMAIGVTPGLLLARSTTNHAFAADGQAIEVRGTYVMPWTLMGIMLVGVPALAALISMLFARRNPTLTRREH